MSQSIHSIRSMDLWIVPLATVLATSATALADPKGDTPMTLEQRVNQYAPVRLTADLKSLTENERKMVPLLIDAAKQMDDAFWIQACGDKQSLLSHLTDPHMKRFAEINYGPWDRLNDNAPFAPGIAVKPDGANFYPPDLKKDDFESFLNTHPDRADALKNLYTIIRRDADGSLSPIPYHTFFEKQVTAAAENLRQAAALAEDPGLKKYLTLRAQALLDDNYQPSDLAWLEMKSNTIDIVIGPIETYEDQLFGYKAAYEAYLLIKDKDWSRRLSRYAAMLPDLQKSLPVAEAYKKESPGADSDLNAYDVVFYAGDCNAGSKTIAINLPNDEEVQLQKGTRRLQLKNAMRAKYDKILLPIAGALITDDQRKHITFDAFFSDTMFHEVAHGLGIKNTINGKGTVRDVLKEQASALEEGKADILGLYMIARLYDQGELHDGTLMDNYVTFLAGIFRSVRFGAASAHGRANMLRFNFFEREGAFTRDADSGKYRVNFEKMRAATDKLSAKILTLQGNGDYDGVKKWIDEMGDVGPTLQADLNRLSKAGIPVDIVFEQGMDMLR